MTEKQGGSDVRANTTIATPLEARKTGVGEAYLLKGHKWFTSAPMSDFFLTLAKVFIMYYTTATATILPSIHIT